MFKNADEVADVSDAKILELVSEGWGSGLKHILHDDKLEILKQARDIEAEAEKIAFAVRNRYNQIVESSPEDSDDEDYEDYDEGDIDEFMNSIAEELGQCYNGEYEYRPDYFWTPSTC